MTVSPTAVLCNAPQPSFSQRAMPSTLATARSLTLDLCTNVHRAQMHRSSPLLSSDAFTIPVYHRGAPSGVSHLSTAFPCLSTALHCLSSFVHCLFTAAPR